MEIGPKTCNTNTATITTCTSSHPPPLFFTLYTKDTSTSYTQSLPFERKELNLPCIAMAIDKSYVNGLAFTLAQIYQLFFSFLS